MRAASVPDSHEICLSVQDINVLFSQTNLSTVRFEVRHVGYASVRRLFFMDLWFACDRVADAGGGLTAEFNPEVQ